MAHLSLRERRQRRQARQKKGMTLNIVSLIDIFTVLVFFLLLNSTELELLPESRNLHLPESVAETKPQDTIIVMVSRDEIAVRGKTIASVDAVLRSNNPVIPELKAALDQQLHPTAAVVQQAGEQPRSAVTVMGDREISYRLLKKILATCADADYGKLSLAVLQKAGNIAAPGAQPLTGRAP
jgi:biopolymer transport protein ExbD